MVADRWFGSSKTHHGCGGYLADLRLDQRDWVCPQCGLLVDRNANAALNLRDWTGAVDIGKADPDGDVQARWSCRPGAARGRPGGRPTAGRLTQRRGRARPYKTTARWRGPVTPEPNPPWERNPEQGYQSVSAHEHYGSGNGILGAWSPFSPSPSS
ncbi:MAG: zinc ribbon domain-containing protein [Actinomycetes bacterium]